MSGQGGGKGWVVGEGEHPYRRRERGVGWGGGVMNRKPGMGIALKYKFKNFNKKESIDVSYKKVLLIRI